MTVRTAYDGEAHASYHQIHLAGDEDGPEFEMPEAFAGQSNGICGAAAPGCLYLITGLHTGNVGLTVELHEERPALGDDWEEAVEATFTPTMPGGVVTDGFADVVCRLDLQERPYRVRYCGSGMAEGSAMDTRTGDRPQADRYLLQLWPAHAGATEPDRIIRQTSAYAAGRHPASGPANRSR